MAGKGVWGRRSDEEKGEEEGSREREPKETALCRRKGQKGLGRADFKSSIVTLTQAQLALSARRPPSDLPRRLLTLPHTHPT